jgi:hypothetical protein
MQYRGALEGRTYVEGLDHSAAVGLVAVTSLRLIFLPGDGIPPARWLAVHDDAFLGERQAVMLPRLNADLGPIIENGRFTFFRSDGMRLYVLADSGSFDMPAMHSASAIVRYSIDPDSAESPIIIDDPPVIPPERVAIPSAGVMLDFNVNDAEYDRSHDRMVLVASPSPIAWSCSIPSQVRPRR